MANYLFKGLRLTTPDDFQRAVDAVLECASRPIDRVSLSLHAHDLAKLQQLVADTPLSMANAFCWSKSNSPAELPQALLKLAKRARLTWDNRHLSFAEVFDLPWYDWDGSHSGQVRITFSEAFQKPLSAIGADASPDTLRRFAGALGVGAYQDTSEPKTCSSLEEHRQEHLYMATISASRLTEAIPQLAQEFELRDALCSWEICAQPEELRKVLDANRANQRDYPAGCFPLNSGGSSYHFAIQPHWMIPVLNCPLEKALLVADRLISSSSDCVLNIRRTFISWRLQDSSAGPQTQGNGFHFRYEHGRMKLFVGIEQFADSDPPVRTISPRFRDVATRLGAELKSNNLMI